MLAGLVHEKSNGIFCCSNSIGANQKTKRSLLAVVVSFNIVEATMASPSTQHQPSMERKGATDKDYEYYIAKYGGNSQAPPRNNRYQSNLGVLPMEPVMEQRPMGTPPRPPPVSPGGTPGSTDGGGVNPADDEDIDGDEALLDLAQLEELHQEAERMKALGNKHMAAQGKFCLA